MEHNHDHQHHHEVSSENLNRVFFIGIGLNALFTLIEFFFGYLNNSLALLSDASHNLSDVASLIISLIGMKLAQKAATLSYTYGYKKASILASLINAVFLFIVVFGIIREAIERFSSPPEISGNIIMIVAGIGVVINSLSAFLFFKGQKNDINIKGAFLHLMVDALVSIGVVISGLIIRYTQWNLVDPIISILIGVVILITTWGLLKESIRLVIDAVPKSINATQIIEHLNKLGGIVSIHHVHIWALSSQMNAFSAHVQITNDTIEQREIIKGEMKHYLARKNIKHVTLEFEQNKQCDATICH
ncbi:MAG: cation diffusion facilitator family transporter [Prolixibacteraceae bacterium]|jgi:cobalt-zinc-cadmium efflux system protein|nr:cation diffusion facilitator family transporter [Prolixibacteraceae bacterium]